MKPNDPIERGLRRLAEETPPPGHMTRTLAAARAGSERRRKRMNRLFGRTAMAGFAAAALLFGLVFIPVSYDLRVGTVVEAEVIPEAGAGPEDLDRVLFRLQERISLADGLIHSRVERIGDRLSLRLVAARERAKAREFTEQLIAQEKMLRQTKLELEELKIHLGGNVLAWASGGRIRINVRGATAEELEEAIREELAKQGLEGAEVSVEMSEKGDGVRTVEITTEISPGEMEGDSGEVTIDLQLEMTGEEDE